MPKSKINKEYDYDHEKWVVSIINTGKGFNGLIGGHAKIMVEGLIKDDSDNLKLFVAEYHIMEANPEHEETCSPQALKNTRCCYQVLIKEENSYDKLDNKYAELQSKSWYVSREKAEKMIDNIKKEQKEQKEYRVSNFEYFGKFSYFGSKKGHNCATWAEEKLAIAGVGNGKMFMDSYKAIPSSHVGCILM